MVLISGFGGWLLSANYVLANYLTGIQNWPCPFTNWTLWLSFPLFLFPYPIRALKLYLVFKRNVNKVRNHAIDQEKMQLRVTFVEQRFSQSMGKGDSDVKTAIARHKQKKEEAKLVNRGPAVSNIGEGDEETEDVLQKSVRDSHSNAETIPPKPSVDQTISNSAAKKIFHSLFGSLFSNNDTRILGDNKRFSVRDGSSFNIGNTRTPILDKPSILEKYIHHLFVACVTICVIIAFVRQYIPSLGLGTPCVGCFVSLSASIVQTIIIILILSIELGSSLLMYAQQVQDRFRIGLELRIIGFLWFIFFIPAVVLAFNGESCEGLRNPDSCSNYSNFTNFCYYNFAAQHWLIFLCILSTFFVTIFVPVMITHLKGRKRLLNEPPKNLWPNFKALKSLRDCLANPETCEAFQKFCIESFCVENVLFWLDTEQYSHITDRNELRVRAVGIYRRFIDSSGNLFLDLPEDIQNELENKLGEAASKDEDDIDFDIHFQVDNLVFVEAQKEVFRQMEAETFPQFLKSDIARKLYQQFKTQFALVGSLREQRLI